MTMLRGPRSPSGRDVRTVSQNTTRAERVASSNWAPHANCKCVLQCVPQCVTCAWIETYLLTTMTPSHTQLENKAVEFLEMYVLMTMAEERRRALRQEKTPAELGAQAAQAVEEYLVLRKSAGPIPLYR
jgi:hypothetical protein